jgi:hypothetical protein
MPKEKWMKHAFEKRGALKKQLQIPKGETIPRTLLTRIKQAKQGSTIKNPTKIGKRRIAVTGLLKKRVNPVVTAQRYAGKRR